MFSDLLEGSLRLLPGGIGRKIRYAYYRSKYGLLIEIGNDVLIGPNVVFRASNHNYNDKNTLIRLQGHTGGRIVIEDDVWIASNVVILPNVRVGKGAVIAAGAVVNKDVPSYSLAGGVPAQIIKTNCRE
jgi:galactoside O-acetyltransferase